MKLCDFLFHIVFTGLAALLLFAAGFRQGYLFLFSAISVCAWLFIQLLRYCRLQKRQEQIMYLTDSLHETWYASEVLPGPRSSRTPSNILPKHRSAFPYTVT